MTAQCLPNLGPYYATHIRLIIECHNGQWPGVGVAVRRPQCFFAGTALNRGSRPTNLPLAAAVGSLHRWNENLPDSTRNTAISLFFLGVSVMQDGVRAQNRWAVVLAGQQNPALVKQELYVELDHQKSGVWRTILTRLSEDLPLPVWMEILV